MTLTEMFDKYEDEFLRFERIEKPLNSRPDIHAFLLLDSIVAPEPNRLGTLNDIVVCAEHDQIWLDVDVEKLTEVITEEQIRDLHRCGVRYDEDVESLCMFT